MHPRLDAAVRDDGRPPTRIVIDNRPALTT
ncbi:hypothetical protein P3T37_007330 [Kitasatospora sp. MAA4]|nr:hypothetical protein [Kitasatospora sp. MAA4]